MTWGLAPSARIWASSTLEDWMRIFRPLKSLSSRSGLLALMTLKPLSQKARPRMPLASSFFSSPLPIGPLGHLMQLVVVVEDVGQVEDLELLDAERSELGQRRGQHLHRAELQRLHLLLVLVQGAVRVDLDLDPAVGALLGEFLEVLGSLALGGVGGDHVAELDDDGLFRLCGGDAHASGETDK